MTTARDLMLTALDVAPGRPPEQGNLSLALAGAEVIDLLEAQAVTLDDERILPGYHPTTDDPLLDQAAASLRREPPYESVDDWLWRRGRGLSGAYLATLEAEGLLSRERRRGIPFRGGHILLADSPARRAAAGRLTSEEPVLTALATALGLGRADTGATADSPSVDDNGVDTVVAAVHNALMQLEGLRQRRAIEQAAFDNIWRGD
ncbi:MULTISPECIES: GPP34 family phosphoprotein [unclassified Streptomyces]|uniref:GOLPH3/VPS74 family protein n=1 Tax=unclassified Streptomyces TaxID=2593676 RepID=UPI000364C8B6|nr:MULTISPECIES: GPP34 family phosphoprotein [unclassified Streptomyces]MYT28507.1 GPP34 family phosphoprotein [Streptomyces sp. SID8354]